MSCFLEYVLNTIRCSTSSSFQIESVPFPQCMFFYHVLFHICYILRSLDGMSEQLRSDRLVDGVALDSLPAGSMSDSDDELMEASALPGSSQRGRGQAGGGGAGDGSRTTRPQILTAAVRFSPTGREWAAATTQGLQVRHAL